MHIEANGLCTYPDLCIICGETEFWRDRDDIIVNPSITIEVLSKSTHNYDRIEKFSLYREIPSLKEYLLISSKALRLEQYTNQSASEWKLKEYKLSSDKVTVEIISFTLPLIEIYRDVTFTVAG